MAGELRGLPAAVVEDFNLAARAARDGRGRSGVVFTVTIPGAAVSIFVPPEHFDAFTTLIERAASQARSGLVIAPHGTTSPDAGKKP